MIQNYKRIRRLGIRGLAILHTHVLFQKLYIEIACFHTVITIRIICNIFFTIIQIVGGSTLALDETYVEKTTDPKIIHLWTNSSMMSAGFNFDIESFLFSDFLLANSKFSLRSSCQHRHHLQQKKTGRHQLQDPKSYRH